MMTRKGFFYLLGSLLVWFAIAVLLLVGPLGGGVRAYRLGMIFLLTSAVHGVIVHFLIFQYARPKALADAIQTGIFVAFVTLSLYAFVATFLGARVAFALGLTQVDRLLSSQFELILAAALVLFLIQIIVCGSIAGAARWKSFDPGISNQIDVSRDT